MIRIKAKYKPDSPPFRRRVEYFVSYALYPKALNRYVIGRFSGLSHSQKPSHLLFNQTVAFFPGTFMRFTAAGLLRSFT